MCIALQQVNNISIDGLELLVRDVLVSQLGVRLIRLIHHGLKFSLVLQVGSLFLKLVVVILKYLY